MELQNEIREDELRITIIGELDDHSAEEARAYMDGILALNRTVRTLSLDLSGVSFMDSSGLGVILGRYRVMAARGGRLCVCGVSRHVDRILRMSGIYALVEKGE